MALETLVAPVTEPVTLAGARAFLRIGTDGDDSVLTSLLVAAREALEARTGRAFISRTMRQRFLGSIHANLLGTLVPGRAPATSLVAVRLIAEDGTETPAPANLVRLIDGRFMLTALLSPNVMGLSIDYQAGYNTSAASVPEAIKISIYEAVAEALIRRDNGTSEGGKSWNPLVYEVKL